MKLKQLVDFSVNNPDADFWLIRKGDESTVGSPTKTFSPEHIGVTVTRRDLVLPEYLFYVFQYLVMNGTFKSLSHGTTLLKNIRTSDIGNITVTTA